MPTTNKNEFTIEQYEMAREFCLREAEGDLRASGALSQTLIHELGQERFDALVEYAESKLPKDATDGLFAIADAIFALVRVMEDAVRLTEWRNESYDQRTQATEKRTKALEERAKTEQSKADKRGAIWPS